jgi:hypothetical protein
MLSTILASTPAVPTKAWVPVASCLTSEIGRMGSAEDTVFGVTSEGWASARTGLLLSILRAPLFAYRTCKVRQAIGSEQG